MNRFIRVMGLCFITALMLSAFPSVAQSDTPVAEPPFSLKSFIAHTRETLASYRVLYVATPDDEADLRDNRLGAAYLTDTFGIIHVYTLDEAMREDAREPIHGVIVTPLALAQSSIKGRGWLAEAYRHGLAVTFVNVTFVEHMRTLKIRCGKGRAIKLNDYPTDWAASYQFRVHSPSQATVNAVIENYDDCGDGFPKAPVGGYNIGLGSGNDAFGEFYDGLFAIGITAMGVMNAWPDHAEVDKWGYQPIGYWQ
jgi:hypothetical protein